MVGTGRFGRKRTTTSVYTGQSVDLDQAVLTLDLLSALGWLVRHGVPWPGRPGEELQHLLVGAPGVFVLSVDTQETEVDTAAPGDWQPRADEVLAAATDVAAALPGVPVTPVVCFTRADAFAGVAGSVFLCSLRNVVEVLSHAPVRIDDATLAAVRQEVTDRLASPAVTVTVVPAPSPRLPTSAQPEAFEDAEAELRPSSNYDLYAELAHIDGQVVAAGAGDRIAEEATREQHRVEAEQFLEAERIAAAEAERAEEERLALEREEQERLAAVKAARAEHVRREAERREAERREAEQADKERLEAEWREVARHAAQEVARREQQAAELAAGQQAVEEAREPEARLQGSRAAVRAPEEPRWQLAVPKGKGLMAAIAVGVLTIGGIALQQPIGNAVGSVKALFTERAPARFGEQVNVGKTPYHPRLRLHAGHPVAVPGRAEVAIPFRVRNTGEDAWVLAAGDLVMLDRVGVSHSAKAGPPIPQGAVLRASTPVAAGTTVTGFLLFDLPQGQTVKELRLTLGPDETAEGAEDPVVWFSRAR